MTLTVGQVLMKALGLRQGDKVRSVKAMFVPLKDKIQVIEKGKMGTVILVTRLPHEAESYLVDFGNVTMWCDCGDIELPLEQEH